MFFKRLIFLMFVFVLSSQVRAQMARSTAVDFDVSGTVDFPDFLVFVKAFSEQDVKADLDGNGVVEFADFLAFSRAFGQFSDHKRVTFADPNLEFAVRTTLDRLLGDLVIADVRDLTELVVSGGVSPVQNLDGIEHLVSLKSFAAGSASRLDNLSPLGQLENLERVIVSTTKPVSMAPLVALPHLRRLSISGFPVADASLLSDLTSLDSLEVIGRMSPTSPLDLRFLSDMSLAHFRLKNGTEEQAQALRNLSNLQSLWLETVSIKDVSALAGLTHLKHLAVRISDLQDISGLSNLTQLETLSLYRNDVQDLSPLTGLPNLKKLELSPRSSQFVGPLDLNPLASLDLEWLDIQDFETTNLTALSGLQNLQRLGLRACGIKDLPELSGLVHLTSLNLASNEITDISPLGGLTSLESLTINQNPIQDFSPLTFLPNLKTLRIRYRRLPDEDGKSRVVDSEIRDLAWVPQAASLTSLTVMADKVLTDLSPLQSLTELDWLVVTGGSMTDISSVSNLTDLNTLQITYTHSLEDLSPIENLTNLRSVAFQSNQIRDISALAGLPELRSITLSDNLIEDLTPLLDNPDLGEGDSINLRNNPLSDEAKNVQIPALEARGVRVTF